MATVAAMREYPTTIYILPRVVVNFASDLSGGSVYWIMDGYGSSNG
jgi:hypothetical protein